MVSNTKTYVQSKVLYEEIKKRNDGIYIWLIPDEISTLRILDLSSKLPGKLKDGTELHATILYSKTLPDKLYTPDDQCYIARLIRIDHWVDHKNRHILVAALESPVIDRLHASLVEQGALHGHPEFNLHISLAKDVDWNEISMAQVAKLNQQLTNKPLLISFSPELRGSSIL